MGTASKFIQRKVTRKPIFFWLFLLFGMSLIAQEGEVINHIYYGNEQASAELFEEAEMAYRKALSKAPERTEALFNLGNTHFQEQDFDEAKQRFFQTQKFAENKSSKHHAFHNLGNVFMKQKDYAKAVEAYKNALRNNSEDEETRYNYALAKELLEKEQDKEQNQDQNDQQDQNGKDEKVIRTKILERMMKIKREMMVKNRKTKKTRGIKKNRINRSREIQKNSNPKHPDKPNYLQSRSKACWKP